jgi:putative ABC transport system permease protein
VILFGAVLAAAAALLLTAGGLYGALFSIVRQSRREIGIRRPLAPTPSATTWHFIKDAGDWVALGLTLGVFGAIGMNQSAQAVVYGLPSIEPWVLGAAGMVLIVVSLLAVLSPVREAARRDPAEALRHE